MLFSAMKTAWVKNGSLCTIRNPHAAPQYRHLTKFFLFTVVLLFSAIGHTIRKPIDGGIFMAKQGMARPDWTHTQPRNDAPPVPEIQGKAKHGKENVKPIIEGTGEPGLKTFHALKGDGSVGNPNP